MQLGFDFASDRRGSGGRCHFSARDADDAVHLRLDIGWQGRADDRDMSGTAPMIRRVKMSKKAGVVSTSRRRVASTSDDGCSTKSSYYFGTNYPRE